MFFKKDEGYNTLELKDYIGIRTHQLKNDLDTLIKHKNNELDTIKQKLKILEPSLETSFTNQSKEFAIQHNTTFIEKVFKDTSFTHQLQTLMLGLYTGLPSVIIEALGSALNMKSVKKEDFKSIKDYTIPPNLLKKIITQKIGFDKPYKNLNKNLTIKNCSTIRFTPHQNTVALGFNKGEVVKDIGFYKGEAVKDNRFEKQYIQLWDYTKKNGISTLNLPGQMHVGTFNKDGSLFATRFYNTISVFDMNTKKTLHSWNVNKLKSKLTCVSAYCLTFNDSGTILAAANNREIELWNPHTATHIKTLTDPEGYVYATAAYKNILAGAGSIIQLWDMSSGECIRTFKENGNKERSNYREIKVSQEGDILVSLDHEGTIKVWNPGNGQRIKTFSENPFCAITFALNQAGTLLAAGYNNKTIKLLNLKNNTCERILDTHSNMSSYLAFNAESTLLASAGFSNKVNIWNIAPQLTIEQGAFICYYKKQKGKVKERFKPLYASLARSIKKYLPPAQWIDTKKIKLNHDVNIIEQLQEQHNTITELEKIKLRSNPFSNSLHKKKK